MKIFGISLLILSASLMANEMCTSLCGGCIDNLADSTCAKVEVLCRCTAVRDSLVADSIQKAELRKANAKTLVQQIQETCDGEFCSYLIFFENRHIKTLRPTKTPVPATRLRLYRETSSAKEDTTALLKLTPECQNFCGVCPENSTDSTCIKIENICKCSAFAAQEKALAEKATADSLQRIEAFLKRSENLERSVDSVFEFADSTESLSLSLTLRRSDFFLVDVRSLTKKELEPKPDTAAIIVLPPADSTKDTNVISITVIAPDSAKPEAVQPQQPKKNLRNFYAGLSLQAGEFYEHYLFGKEIARNMTFEGGLGAIFRWYFYEFGSFQLGLGADYQYADYDLGDYDAGIKYQSIIAEIPLSFRFGFPVGLGRSLAPFISISLNVRKPIYAWTTVWYYDEASYGDVYNIEDFEFLSFLGLGIELFRHVSIEWQFLLSSLRTYDGDNWDCWRNGTNTWRLKLDFAF